MKIKTLDHVRKLGILFDKNMTMAKQFNKMCKIAYFNMRNLSKIRKILDKETLRTAINVLVSPRLWKCTSIWYKNLSVEQATNGTNSAVRLIWKLKKQDSVRNFRKQLHRLPIPARMQFKLMTTTWKALHNLAPKYIQPLVRKRQQQNHNVRSNKKF